METPDPNMIHISSMYGALSETPYVKLNWGEKEAVLTPEEAIDHAVRVIQVASNSEADAAFIRYLQLKLGIEKERIPEIIRDFRAMRESEWK